MKSEERFSLPFSLLWQFGFLKLGKIDFPIHGRFPIRAGIWVGDSNANGCWSPFALIIQRLHRPAFVDTFRLDLKLPLLSRVDIQIVEGI